MTTLLTSILAAIWPEVRAAECDAEIAEVFENRLVQIEGFAFAAMREFEDAAAGRAMGEIEGPQAARLRAAAHCEKALYLVGADADEWRVSTAEEVPGALLRYCAAVRVGAY